ncbi:MAG TPA: HD domain-containing phosphohydrolase, partial [Methylophilus sp.]|nr:HD domain-containing phosphohydrolase [Methylophilus sp.]
VNDAGHKVKFLSDDEVHCLTITRGTLTPEERQVINNHIVVTINMLESLPYPEHLKRVPEYAGGHHERMDGKGYPKGLKREQMSVPARMMGVADIFEALTSKDRPYKKAKTLSETLAILARMKREHHIDPDVFELFIRERIYLKYAEEFLDPEQIDYVDEEAILRDGVF